MTKKKGAFAAIFAIVWFTAGIFFLLWLVYSYQSHGVDKSLFRSYDFVSVENAKDYYSFTPDDASDHVLIFYPGAMVDPKAYVPLCREIAENHIKVYLIKMPWRLASKGYGKPKELGLLSDTSKTYILAGHSQGGKMAAQFVFENPGAVDKLILIGTTHPRDITLSESQIPVLKIYGSNDGVADEKSVMGNKSKLPASTRFFKIEGANHAQFGYYGSQLGDHKAGISREQQQEETVKSMLEFIDE